MELNINQKCQLIVSGDWDIEYFNPENQNKIELLVYDDDWTTYKIEKNRTSETLVWDLEKDGLYKYYQFNLNKSVTNVDVSNPESLIKYYNSNATSTDRNCTRIFSICKLRNCTVQLEKESIHNFINHPCRKMSDQSNRDLMLIAIFVLENLIVQQEYTKASMIVEALSTCNTLCKSNKSQTCNCHE